MIWYLYKLICENSLKLIASYSFWIHSLILSDFESNCLALILDLSSTLAQVLSAIHSFLLSHWYFRVASAALQNPSLLVFYLFSTSPVKPVQAEVLRQDRSRSLYSFCIIPFLKRLTLYLFSLDFLWLAFFSFSQMDPTTRKWSV